MPGVLHVTTSPTRPNPGVHEPQLPEQLSNLTGWPCAPPASDPYLGRIRLGLRGWRPLPLCQLPSAHLPVSPALPRATQPRRECPQGPTGVTQVSLMTFSNVVISTSVKIWSISGMSRAPLEAGGETVSPEAGLGSGLGGTREEGAGLLT